MTCPQRALYTALAVAAVLSATGGCAHLQPGGALATQPSPAPSGSPSPAPCGSPVPGALYVAMASYVTATTDPTYGVIDGYALVATDGTYSNVAQPIAVRPGDVVQFVNVEPATGTGQAPIQHSAVGLQTAHFPANPTFPTGAQGPLGNTISAGAWSTGRIPATPTTLCYSAPLTAAISGTYYFGDYDYYSSSNMRDVIVVSASAVR